MTHQDTWSEGYRAARDYGAQYSDNPHQQEPAATAWAFGCDQGLKDRNADAIREIMGALQ